MRANRTDRICETSDRIGLISLYLIAVASVLGFGVFRLWPGLLATIPNAAAVYPRAFEFFPRAQIVLAFAVLAFHLSRRVGARWVAPFGAAYAISLSSELSGTTIGLPFGPYRYTGALGAMWFGHVPILIPVSWFMMALPSFALAGSSLGPAPSPARRVVLGSLILLAWDLALDPAMSAATAFWVWGEPGSYYGMPWLNLFGWFVTGAVIMTAFAALRVDRWTSSLSPRWVAGYYGANLALPVGLAAVAGLWGALAVTAVAVMACWMFARARRVPQTAAA